MTMQLVPLCTFTGNVSTSFDVGRTPAGRRIVFQVTEGRVLGERFAGHQVGQVDADWLIIGPGGTGQLDVRLLVETHDGALVYIQYDGRVDTRDPAAPVYSAPRFETGDPRYHWLNRIQAVGKGTRSDDVLTYEICEVR
jgi:hypothetical protein